MTASRRVCKRAQQYSCRIVLALGTADRAELGRLHINAHDNQLIRHRADDARWAVPMHRQIRAEHTGQPTQRRVPDQPDT